MGVFRQTKKTEVFKVEDGLGIKDANPLFKLWKENINQNLMFKGYGINTYFNLLEMFKCLRMVKYP